MPKDQNSQMSKQCNSNISIIQVNIHGICGVGDLYTDGSLYNRNDVLFYKMICTTHPTTYIIFIIQICVMEL